MSNQSSTVGTQADDEERFEDLPDGAGCVEIWSHLSEGRDGRSAE